MIHGPRTSISPAVLPSHGERLARRRRRCAARRRRRSRPVFARQSISSSARRALRRQRDRRERARLGHAPRLDDADAVALLEALHQAARHGRAAARPRGGATRGRAWSPRRGAGCRSRSSARRAAIVGFSLRDHAGERRRLQEAARQHEVGADLPRRVRQAPGVGVEHRHDQQDAIAVVQRVGRRRLRDGERVQPGRAVAVDRRPSGCRWCRSCSTWPRRCALVDRPATRSRAARRRAAPRSAARRGRARVASPLADHDHVLAPSSARSRTLASCGTSESVDDHDAVLGVVGDVDELLGEEPDVERVQHGAHRRHREVGLEVLLRVPAEGRDALGPALMPRRVSAAARRSARSATCGERRVPRAIALANVATVLSACTVRP